MQPVETLLLLFVAGNLFYFLFGKKHDKRFAYSGLALLVIHMLLGEMRWQMGPAYLILLTVLGVHFFQIKTRKGWRIPSCLLGLLFTLLSSALCYALPVFSLYQPTGSYEIASTLRYLKDTSRLEDISSAPDDTRELMIDIYYPVDKATGTRTAYLKPVERKGFARKYGLPAQAFTYLDGVATYVHQGEPSMASSHPVLIFSPGYYTPASGYHSIVSELVSHGFIVFSINHSYETMASRFPDGREIYFDQAYADAHNWSDAMGEAVRHFDNAPEEEKYEAIRAVNTANTGAKRTVARWSADIRSLLDAIEAWNQEPDFPLAGKMKLDQVGALGHSRGGAAAVNASISDLRIKAAANLDGAQWGRIVDSKLDRPTAMISSATSVLYDVNKYLFQDAKGEDFYDVVLTHSGHSNFSDIPYMIRIPQLNEAGSIDPQEASAAFNSFLIAFFQKHLEGKAIDIESVVAKNKNFIWKE